MAQIEKTLIDGVSSKGFWEVVGDVVVKTAGIAGDTAVKMMVVSAGSIVITGGAVTYLVPYFGSRKLFDVGTVMIKEPIVKTFEGKKLDFEELGDKMSEVTKYER